MSVTIALGTTSRAGETTKIPTRRTCSRTSTLVRSHAFRLSRPARRLPAGAVIRASDVTAGCECLRVFHANSRGPREAVRKKTVVSAVGTYQMRIGGSRSRGCGALRSLRADGSAPSPGVVSCDPSMACWMAAGMRGARSMRRRRCLHPRSTTSRTAAAAAAVVRWRSAVQSRVGSVGATSPPAVRCDVDCRLRGRSRRVIISCADSGGRVDAERRSSLLHVPSIRATVRLARRSISARDLCRSDMDNCSGMPRQSRRCPKALTTAMHMKRRDQRPMP